CKAMPIYEYKCSACSHELESLQKFSDAPLVKCPACGKDTLTKLVSAAGFQLKGSGWYQTDFRSSGAKPAAASGTGKAETGKADAGGADSGKESAKSGGAASTDAKPAAPVVPAAASGGTPTAGA
ncbi:MAG TPA: zinc ribbon domain-containing protein, partial [Casimicrobiaceae bacterium]